MPLLIKPAELHIILPSRLRSWPMKSVEKYRKYGFNWRINPYPKGIFVEHCRLEILQGGIYYKPRLQSLHVTSIKVLHSGMSSTTWQSQPVPSFIPLSQYRLKPAAWKRVANVMFYNLYLFLKPYVTAYNIRTVKTAIQIFVQVILMVTDYAQHLGANKLQCKHLYT